MTDEMLGAQAEWLPQYAAEIPIAKSRLEAHVANGTRGKKMRIFKNTTGDTSSVSVNVPLNWGYSQTLML